MTNILVSDAETKTKNLLMQCLSTAGFEVIITENGLVNVQLAHEKFSTITESKKSNT